MNEWQSLPLTYGWSDKVVSLALPLRMEDDYIRVCVCVYTHRGLSQDGNTKQGR